MSHRDEISAADPEPTPNPRAKEADKAGPEDWLDALNSFLERANKADLDTGC